jgi:hypothetical protein
MEKEEEYKKLVEKVDNIINKKKIDLSSDEDLSIGIMNLISIEEHLFFTAQKTSKDEYYKLLYEVREMRKKLLKQLIKEYEGEVWCISKHLLASSMRLMEVGTKLLSQKKEKEAKELFKMSYELYSLFWHLNLNQKADPNLEHKKEIKKDKEEKEGSDFLSKIKTKVEDLLDCCIE